MLRSLLVSLFVSLFLVAACSVGAPPTASPAPPTAAPTAAPSGVPTAAPTTVPTYAPGASGSPYCDPEMGYGNYGCEESPGADTPAPVGEATVKLSEDGTYLVGANGLSLYVFDNDSPGTSACTSGGCAGAWPALIVEEGVEPTGGEGVTGTLTTFHRPDGSHQVQYNDRPLYTFSGDAGPGDTSGDGVNGTWHLATP
jgi:predicted lipoprotein with Yx(FWY)xxD motif